ncbi:MAG: hypothetical protein FD127_2933 [Acidimicrobiaceae bacterium]|nr:MAG: hypothetical protein FD127_2933 [Acidimicrobiaceae bacterium]
MFVDHHDCSDLRRGGPHRAAAPDDDIGAAGGNGPVVRHHRHRQTVGAQPRRHPQHRIVHRVHHDDPPMCGRCSDRVESIVVRPDAHDATAIGEKSDHRIGNHRTECGPAANSRVPTRSCGGAPAHVGHRPHHRRRAGAHQERPQPADTPALCSPARQVDDVSRWAVARPLGDRHQTVGGHLGRRHSEADDPSCGTSVGERYPHHRADLHQVAELGRNQVVERLVETGEVGQNRGDEQTICRSGGAHDRDLLTDISGAPASVAVRCQSPTALL